MKYLTLLLLLAPSTSFAGKGVDLKTVIETTKFFCMEKGRSIEAYDLQSNAKELSEESEQIINDCSTCTNPEEKRDGSVEFKLSENKLTARGRITNVGNTHLTFEAYELRMNFRLAHLNNGNNAIETELFLSRSEDSDIHHKKVRTVLPAAWFLKHGSQPKRLPAGEFQLKGLVPEGFDKLSEDERKEFEKTTELYSGDFTHMTVKCYFERVAKPSSEE